MDVRACFPQALLGEAPRGHAAEAGEGVIPERECCPPDLGDLIVVLLAGTLAGLRDRLVCDGFEDAAELVGDLVELADGYLSTVA
jgi:hypothetical protein